MTGKWNPCYRKRTENIHFLSCGILQQQQQHLCIMRDTKERWCVVTQTAWYCGHRKQKALGSRQQLKV